MSDTQQGGRGMAEKLNATESMSTVMMMATNLTESLGGAPYFTYDFQCVAPDGTVRWSETVKNLVTTVGKNDLLDKYFAGSTYTATWFMGLIASTSYTAVAAGDTMSSHAGWLEAGATNAPTYTAPRKTLAFNAASGGSKATSAAASFVFSGSGTVQGAFVVGSTGATSTIDNTAGILYSGSALGTTRPVLANDTLNVSLTLSV